MFDPEKGLCVMCDYRVHDPRGVRCSAPSAYVCPIDRARMARLEARRLVDAVKESMYAGADNAPGWRSSAHLGDCPGYRSRVQDEMALYLNAFLEELLELIELSLEHMAGASIRSIEALLETKGDCNGVPSL